MSKPIILLIHGMGTHPPGNMRKEFIDGINDTAKLFEITDFDIEEKAQIEEFNYSNSAKLQLTMKALKSDFG